MVIALLASFTPLLEEGGCQHNPSFLGDFLRVGLPLRPAKSPKGLCRMPTLCGVSYGQMAKVELLETVWKIRIGLDLGCSEGPKQGEDVPSRPLVPLNTGDQEPSGYFPDSL